METGDIMGPAASVGRGAGAGAGAGATLGRGAGAGAGAGAVLGRGAGMELRRSRLRRSASYSTSTSSPLSLMYLSVFYVM